MRWWKHGHSNGKTDYGKHESNVDINDFEEALNEARRAVKSAEERWPRVERAKEGFAAQLDFAFTRRRRHS